MKHILILSSAVLVLASCCHKVACPDMTGMSVIFEGFSDQQRDSIFIKAYTPASDFSVVTDSFFFGDRFSYSNDTGIFLSSDSHWIIRVPANDNRQYRFNGYAIEKHTCSNGCGFKKGDEYETMNGYTLDGTSYSGTEAIIKKQ